MNQSGPGYISGQIKSDQIRPDQTRPSETKPDLALAVALCRLYSIATIVIYLQDHLLRSVMVDVDVDVDIELGIGSGITFT